ncbi:MAG: hypothetical protein QOK40_2133, partial [Miltoncostaeaceae bacterium]|nr:hypothetical protein [Miltoncostaeaceae bacterium]
MQPRVRLAAALALTLAALPAAAAAAPWGPAQPVPGLPPGATTPAVTVDASGRAEAFLVYGRVVRVASRGPKAVRWRVGTSLLRKPVAQLLRPSLAVARSGAAVATWRRGSTLRAALRAGPGAAFGPPVILSRGAGEWHEAVNEAGAAAVVYEAGGQSWLALRPAGAAAFGPPESLDPSGGTSPAVTLTSGGEAVLAWEASAGLATAVRPPAGPIGPPSSLPDAGDDPRLGVDGADLVTLVANYQGNLTASTRPAGGAFTTPETVVTADFEGASEEICCHRLVVDSAGVAALSYGGTAHGGVNYEAVQVRLRPGTAWRAQLRVIDDYVDFDTGFVTPTASHVALG